MYCHRIYQALKISRCTEKVFLNPLLGLYELHGCGSNARLIHKNATQYKSTIVFHKDTNQEGFVKRMLKRVGVFDISRSRLKVAGYILYENVADRVPYEQFFEEFQLPDTFYSWFLVTELHVWMLMVRTMAEGEEGHFVRNNIIEAMWGDISVRAKKVEPGNPVVKSDIKELHQQFFAALLSYDEGLLSDDKVLAGAVWRRLLEKNCDEPEHIERLVHYIRKQVKVLDEMKREEILLSPSIKWIDIPR